METEKPVTSSTPTAEEMFQRIHEVDLDRLDQKSLTEELKGDKAWIFVMVMPLAALILVIMTLLGMFLLDSLIISFVVSAFFVFAIGKMLDNYEKQFKFAAHQEVINRIAEYEGSFGLIPHFKHFLPKKYTYLRQSLKRKNYTFIDQYISAVFLLQSRLDPEKFARIWHIKHPDTVPEEELLAEAIIKGEKPVFRGEKV